MKKNCEVHNYLYDIIDFWLSSSDNEYYMMEFIKNSQELYMLDDIGSVIIDYFIKSCNDELSNQKHDVVDKYYYVKLYSELINNPNYRRNEDKTINLKIKTFREYIQSSKFKHSRKHEVLKAIDALEKGIEPQELETVPSPLLSEQLRYCQDYLKMSIGDNRDDLSKENTVLFNNDGVSYSLNYDENALLLKVHVIDTSSLIMPYTPLAKDMKNNNLLDSRAREKFKFQLGKISPVITYQLKILPNGQIDDMQIYKGLVKPKIKYKEALNDVKELEPFTALAFKLQDVYDLDTGVDDISKVFNDLVEKNVCQRMREKELSLIYKVQETPDLEEYAYQLTNLNWYLARISDREFKIIYQILCNHKNTLSHYDLEDKGHYGIGKSNNTALFKPFTYIGLVTQKLVNDAFLNFSSLTTKEIQENYGEDIVELVNYYNSLFFNYDKQIEKSSKCVLKKVYKNK